MASFDFITDEDFRRSLENDFKEMNFCIQAGAYKAAIVVAGSIIEAVLIDYVIAENIIARDEALKLDLGKVLSLCKDKKIISEKTSDLSSAVKGYRNLIHPGRTIRLNESISKETTEVAKALVEIVVGEVEKQKKENYGYTAEQIVSKIKHDSNSKPILPLLIKKTNLIELERLMFKYLPEAFTKGRSRFENSYGDGDFISLEAAEASLILCFRLAFETVDENSKRKVAAWFAKLRSEESDQIIEGYGTAFIRASDMQYMSKDDATLVKHYMLGRLNNNMGTIVLDSLSGIGKYIELADVQKFTDPLIRFVCQKSAMPIWVEMVNTLFERESSEFSDEVKEAIYSRVNQWRESYKEKEQPDSVQKVSRIMSSIDIPF
jgi:hypothetical protein